MAARENKEARCFPTWVVFCTRSGNIAPPCFRSASIGRAPIQRVALDREALPQRIQPIIGHMRHAEFSLRRHGLTVKITARGF